MRPATPPQCLLTILLFLMTGESAKPPCPTRQPCQCTDLRIKCVQQDGPQLNYISRIPYFEPKNFETRYWSFSYHEMRVRDQALTNLSLRFDWGVLSLRRVEVTNSLVRQILPNAFKGLIGVQSLNLSHNLLSSLSPTDLSELTQLRELILHDNQIRVVHAGAFQSTPFIVQLYLSHNRLSDIPQDIRQLSSLTHLYLQFNNISTIRDYSFAGLRKLIVLDLGALRRNLLIESRAFCGLGSGDNLEDENVGGSDGAYAETHSSSSGSSGHPVSIMSRRRSLAALYLRYNVLHDLNLCALGKISGLRVLNLSSSIIPCTCQSASLANQSTWQVDYGFSPQYVTYESWQLTNCELGDRCRTAQGRTCPRARCQRQSAYQSRPAGAVIRDWQFSDVRLSYKDERMSSGSNGSWSLLCVLLNLLSALSVWTLVNSIFTSVVGV